MNTKSLATLLSTLLVAVGSISCSRARSDADITADVQARIHADSALTAAPITGTARRQSPNGSRNGHRFLEAATARFDGRSTEYVFDKPCWRGLCREGEGNGA